MKTILNENGFAISDGFVHVYHTDASTGEYINESNEFLTQGVGLPAHSFIEPPLKAKEGFAVCRTESGWEYKTDYRNSVAYSTESGSQSRVTELGELPANLTFLVPKTQFDQWNGVEWVTDLAAQRQAEIDTAKAEKYRLERGAKEMIEKLSDALDLNMALDGDEARLTAWRKYRVLLNQLDINTASDIAWPLQPTE
ncbi:tail fiber assembly protein [Budvicia aquatica]|uniref:Bacteriophage tail assembly protein n=1 Tax=Budvicia aquatica TaxID=82979 RepID=A0A2C6DMZ8_9GAMM|nr:tail fiber assembly protein [Budvicia aquatica]PHI29702.1 tail assembly chaperone [Budvicia aquatica]VFS48086.1 Bacteriophage tail assembly protein [Budvicia aquatica]